MPTHLIHVRYSDSGDWIVQPEGHATPLSQHESATAAERAAIEHAAGRDDAHVVIHDRYGRVRFAPATRRTRSGDRVRAGRH